MDCAVASAPGLSARGCSFVFCASELEECRGWRSGWSFWFVLAGIRSGLSEKAGSTDDDRALLIYAESTLPWQRGTVGRGGLGDAFVDFGRRSRCLFLGRLLHSDAKGRGRAAWPLRRCI